MVVCPKCNLVLQTPDVVLFKSSICEAPGLLEMGRVVGMGRGATLLVGP